jgi:hypothetical protein
MSSQQSSAPVLSSLSSSCEVLYPSRGRVAESGYSGRMESAVRDSGPVGPDAAGGVDAPPTNYKLTANVCAKKAIPLISK